MLPKKVFEWTLYIALLITALVLVKQPFENYINGSTDYLNFKEQLTPMDLPTVSVCVWFLDFFDFEINEWIALDKMKFEYGKHLQIHLKVSGKEPKTVALQENTTLVAENVYQLFPRQIKIHEESRDLLLSFFENKFTVHLYLESFQP